MTKLISILLIVIFATSLQAQTKIAAKGSSATCPKFTSIKNLDLQKFTGTW